MGAGVKVMLSYDYCHFEISKSTDQDVSNEVIDDMRKDCMRLADKAIAQYKVAKDVATKRFYRKEEYDRMVDRVKRIKEKTKHDRTPEDRAILKAFQDKNWDEYISSKYDYEDEFCYEDDENEDDFIY